MALYNHMYVEILNVNELCVHNIIELVVSKYS